MRRFILCLLLVSVFATPVFAAKQKAAAPEKTAGGKTDDALVEPDPDSVPVLQKVKGSRKELAYDYLGNRFGVDAWLLSGPNVMQIVYTTKTNPSAMIGGALVGPDGKEVGSDMIKQFMVKYPERAQEILALVRTQVTSGQVDKPAAAANSPSEILWQKLQQGGKITFGTNKDAPVLFAVLDPVAPATMDVWKHLGPIAKDNKIILNILPLGLTTADSIMEIATTLGDQDPQGAWEKLMNGQASVKTGTPDSTGVLGMKANVDLAQSLNLRNLPLIVYRDKDGKIRIIQGVPKDWDGFTKELNSLK
jgi:hypothetical protein